MTLKQANKNHFSSDLCLSISDFILGIEISRVSTALKHFMLKAGGCSVDKELKDADKLYNGLEKDQEKLVRENENLHSLVKRNKETIEQAKKDIETAKNDIVTNTKNQETKKGEIKNQLIIVTALHEKRSAIK
ncbi:MAG: hypothetical protein HRT72_08065 [Flavobacteriales bacterium]|nr:hypothetical protein [Flavobacteriales bacterium]